MLWIGLLGNQSSCRRIRTKKKAGASGVLLEKVMTIQNTASVVRAPARDRWHDHLGNLRSIVSKDRGGSREPGSWHGTRGGSWPEGPGENCHED